MSDSPLMWNDMETAPRDGTRIWLTDGKEVHVCAWEHDAHGLLGWRITISNRSPDWSHYRTFKAVGWRPYFEPEPPDVPRQVYDWNPRNGQSK